MTKHDGDTRIFMKNYEVPLARVNKLCHMESTSSMNK